MNKKLVYICSPYSSPTKKGIEENIAMANAIGHSFWKRYKMIPVIPHNLFPFIKYEETENERDFAIKASIQILQKCDLICVYNNRITAGMKKEIEYAKKNNIPFINCASVKEFEYIKPKKEEMMKHNKKNSCCATCLYCMRICKNVESTFYGQPRSIGDSCKKYIHWVDGSKNAINN